VCLVNSKENAVSLYSNKIERSVRNMGESQFGTNTQHQKMINKKNFANQYVKKNVIDEEFL